MRHNGFSVATMKMSILALGLAVLMTTASASAGFILDPNTYPDLQDRTFGGTFGYEFTVQSDHLSITSLGMYDDGQDGLNVSHDVGLYDVDTQALLTSATIPAGDTATLVGYYRFVALPDEVALVNGQTYRIAVTASGDTHRQNGSDLSYMSSDFTWDSGAWVSSETLAYPEKNSAAGEFVGPNFQYVPEPATLGVLALGGLAMIRRRR